MVIDLDTTTNVKPFFYFNYVASYMASNAIRYSYQPLKVSEFTGLDNIGLVKMWFVTLNATIMTYIKCNP